MNLENEHSSQGVDNKSSTESVSPRKPASFFQERPPQVMEVVPRRLRRWSRRDLLLFGAGAIAAIAGGGSLLPQATVECLGIIHENKNWPKKEWLLNRSLRIDDDVAEALYSKITWCQSTPNRKLRRSRTITTEPLPTPVIFQNDVLTLDDKLRESVRREQRGSGRRHERRLPREDPRESSQPPGKSPKKKQDAS
jgi:hypothetical protein